MVKLEEVTTKPTFSNQLENKILYSNHDQDISISYESTYTLKYVLEGSKQYDINKQTVEVLPGQYVLLNQDTITTRANKGTRGISIFLAPKLIYEIYDYHIIDRSGFKFFEIPQKKSISKIGAVLGVMTQCIEQNPIAIDSQMDTLFLQLSEMIVEDQLAIQNGFSTLQIIKHTTKKELFQRITDVKEYLNDNIANHISLETICQHVGISKYYLHRLFKEICGLTPLSYLTTIRLEKAKKRLQQSNNTIFEIAIDCGFENTPYFSNTFKRHVGVTPTQYRNGL